MYHRSAESSEVEDKIKVKKDFTTEGAEFSEVEGQNKNQGKRFIYHGGAEARRKKQQELKGFLPQRPQRLKTKSKSKSKKDFIAETRRRKNRGWCTQELKLETLFTCNGIVYSGLWGSAVDINSTSDIFLNRLPGLTSSQ